MATYYCNQDTGSDAAAGTSGAPFLTLDKALTVAAANDTVVLAPATVDYVWASKTLPDGLTIKCLTLPDVVKGSYARLNAGGGAPSFTLSGSVTCENLVFYNYTPTVASSGFYLNHLSGIDQVVQFTGCVFDTISGVSSTAARGGFVGNGVSLGGFTQNSITVNFDRCLFLNVKRSGSAPYAMTHFNGSAHSANVRECTWYDDGTGNPATGVIMDYALSGYSAPYFRNTILVADGVGPTYLMAAYNGTAINSTAENCCYYGGIDITNAALTACINADPLFLDKGAKDFRLKPASPCIDAGKLV